MKIEKNIFFAFIPRLKSGAFCKSLGKIYMILDNTMDHHAGQLRPLLDRFRGELELVFFPPYSASLSKIEQLWPLVKREVVYNTF
ncbi:MAG: transposase [Candidatus Helarchaeota archaeon]